MLTLKGQSLCLITLPNTEKSVENKTLSGVFLTSFEVFGNVIKYLLEVLGISS